MKTKKLKEKIYKIIAVYLAINLLAQIFAPTAAYALTSGPSNPEVESFEPVSTNQMVDLFSGDFNYNLPLLTVPGPNGGYPINLAYHAGIAMEQEASWVGLGWNINPGAITRNMRGLPDDFNGEKVKKSLSLRPNMTAGFAISSLSVPNDVELFGFNATLQAKTYQIRYNNYKGVGFSYNRSRTYRLKSNVTDAANPNMNFERLDLTSGLDFDSQNGIGVQPSINYSKMLKNDKITRYATFTTGMTYHSRSGISDLSFSFSRLKKNSVTHTDKYIKKNALYPGRGAGCSFSAGSYIPSTVNSLDGFSLSGFFKNGTAPPGTGLHWSKSKEIFFSFEDILDKDHDYPAYGYNYVHNRVNGGDDDAMMDFNRQADFAITKDAPGLPVPVMTNDVYAVTGQGIGMVFRPYRSDIGAVYSPKATSDFGSARLGNEPGGGSHLGLNLAASYVHNYSGKWKDKWDELDGNDYEFKSTNGLSESFYFKASGEQVADDDAYGETSRFGGESPVDFRLDMTFDGTLSWEPEVHNKYPHNSNAVLTYNLRNKRARRSQNIEYRTRGQMVSDPDYANRANYLFTENALPDAVSNPGTQYDYSNDFSGKIKGSQIGEISALNPDGNRYVYGLPVYNISDKSAFFSVDHPSSFSKTVAYSGTEASKDNHSGIDHLYSSAEIPPYAYSYLLTAIYSADYVDVTGNGPSEDDLGYYVKFNYSSSTDYNWRTPYTKADYDQGFYSNDNDDKASYSFGSRQVYFLHSIETKTHIAQFHVSSRKDARGAYQEANTSGSYGSALKKLDDIQLFSKQDLVTPIKTVHFKYSYDLCPGVENNDGSADSSPNVIGSNDNAGKLTLKEVWFTYQNNEKGSLTPYKFYYREDLPDYNPGYDLLQTDCWGNYKPDNAGAVLNEELPYVSQKTTDRTDLDKHMAAWNLYQVTLPSGGKLTVDYESDEYAYVQDKKAMEMFTIASTGTTGETTYTPSSGDLGSTGNGIKDRIYFTLNEPEPVATADISHYIDGVSDMYFKAYMKVPKVIDSDGSVYDLENKDYVEGYCKISPSDCGFDPSSVVSGHYTRGYIAVKPVSVSSLNIGTTTVHPFRKATWEYLRMHRSDLLYPSNPISDQDILSLNVFESVITLFNDFSGMLLGYYNSCLVKGFSKEMSLSTSHPSIIRLNTPDKCKKGGGHRVKKITLNDEWNAQTGNQESDFAYGQEYIYNSPDGASYGVAEYEPLIGGAENPLHLPTDKASTERRMVINDKSFYMEYPLCEAYYPGANVGYSKVIVRNLEHTEATKTASGYSVTEFYTAKDFPVKEYPTPVEHKQYHPVGIFIPFIGQQEFDNNGYSQGFTVELNDMHGKLKAQSTYAYNSDYTDPDQATSRTEYIYNTVNPYNPEAPNRLLNLVTVLDGDANDRLALMGQQTDFFYDMDQHSSTSFQLGLQSNVDNAAIGAFVPSLIPSLNYSFSMFRSIVAMKVVNKTGILVETRTRNQGSRATEKNLMFDSHTGAPLLTSITNDFDKPVYTYNYPAHWSYDAMDQAAINYGFSCGSEGTVTSGYFQFNTSSPFQNDDMPDYLSVGDKVLLTVGTSSPAYYWVARFNSNGDAVQFINETGTTLSSGTINSLRVVKSGRTNQTSVTNGTLVSLQNPVTGTRIFPLFTAFNTALDHASSVPASISFTDCATGASKTAYVTVGSDFIKFSDNPTCTTRCDCDGFIYCDPSVISLGVIHLAFVKQGNNVLIKYTNGSTHAEYSGTWVDARHCYNECMDGVLHAEAYRFTDDWSYAYADAGIASTSPLLTATNGYRYGTKGIWRNESSYLYQVNRKQGSPNTNIAEDGTYDNFVFFHWDPNNAQASTNYDNPLWTFVSAETRYSPFGFDMETRNALDIYSAAQYGYNNSVSTLVASNATYFETAFDGLEDYTGNTYPSSGNGHGHLTLQTSSGAPLLKTDHAHTGSVSMDLSSQVNYNSIPVVAKNSINPNIPATAQTQFSFVANKKYVVTAWVYSGATGATPSVSVTGGVNVSTTVMSQKIEGWQHIETTFEAPSSGSVSIHISYSGGNGSERLDDIRIQPFQSAMKTYVYDPVRLWLVATLDDRDFATFYNYDEEGRLVQVKSETERGIFTVNTSRSNLQH